MNKIIDLRSDTVTKPTEKMRDAIRNAEVGDNVMGEDKTVQQLEERCKDIFQKEDAMFVVSGTMANQIVVMSQCQRGDQIIVSNRSHIYNLEVAGISATSGVQPRAVHSPGGCFNLINLKKEIHKADIQRAPTVMICLENTFDLNRGLVTPADCIDELCSFVKPYGVFVYLDGARIFNAAIASNLPVSRICKHVDAVAFCLSKGLACPIGSILLGDKDFIEKAKRMRQRLGGGWRQAGIIAAAGIVALNEMIERLSEDHKHAKILATRLRGLGLGIDLEQVQTNIVYLDLSTLGIDANYFVEKLSHLGIKVKPVEEKAVRMVTHKDISRDDIDIVLNSISNFISQEKLMKNKV